MIGRTLNTNAYWMGKRLALMGSMIERMTSVDDDLAEISSGLNEILGRRPEFVVVLGGLGPTPDDMTLKGVARALNVQLRLSQDGLRLMKESYAKRNREFAMTPARRKMAVLPVGSSALPNNVGTAPGVRIERGGSVIFCLPGVPKEMMSIFRESVEPEIQRSLGELHRRAIRFKISGVFESSLAPVIQKELERYPGTYIKSHPRGVTNGASRLELDIVSVKRKKPESDATALAVAEEMLAAIKEEGGVVIESQGFSSR